MHFLISGKVEMGHYPLRYNSQLDNSELSILNDIYFSLTKVMYSNDKIKILVEYFNSYFFFLNSKHYILYISYFAIHEYTYVVHTVTMAQ